MKLFLAAVAAAMLAAMSTAALAHEYKLGDLDIEHPHARATPPHAPTGAGYLTITNTGSEPDRLIGGTADFAGDVQIHEMSMDGDVMRMREVEGGLEIPPGGELTLEPGGNHIMFIHLGEPLRAGERRKVTLEFERAGTIEVEFSVEDMAAGGSMDGGAMDHSGQ